MMGKWQARLLYWIGIVTASLAVSHVVVMVAFDWEGWSFPVRFAIAMALATVGVAISVSVARFYGKKPKQTVSERIRYAIVKVLVITPLVYALFMEFNPIPMHWWIRLWLGDR